MGVNVAQMKFEFRTWGGKRKGAGRKRTAKRPSTPHRRRPVHKRRYPVLVTIRVADDVASLRHRGRQIAFQEALIITSRRERFRIVHYSIQGNHLHLIVEAHDATELARGMQGFQISAAKHLNKILGRKGQVFVGRYHAAELTTPTQVRNALTYLFNNWRKHDADRRARERFDPFSNGILFGGWRGEPAWLPKADIPKVWMPTRFAETWLLREGWKKAGLLSPFERPG